MAKLTLRDIELIYDGDELTICSVSRPETRLTLDPDAVDELVDFVETIQKTKVAIAEQDNQRQSFRVPIVRRDDLHVEINFRGMDFEARPDNISMTGLFIRSHDRDPVKFQIGDEATLTLTCNGESTELEGIVRRMGRNGYGFFFPACVRFEQVDPPPEVRRIVMELQRRWMMYRTD
ncbi:PilZ domain-containing protein [Stieleria sp. JC731]|uniref:PilZ domain-containing protein n=1 Tax=Pirellulaceae TaxID=2691357 RepID=UPI001E38C887|nr:PilZ domain-containing protein [Stieleria sp. JC731]MCC9601175.1 PilZ domain-containing protein [Stieleria sp. JC731]